MKILNFPESASRKKHYSEKNREWSSYSKNYVDGTSKLGHKVLGSLCVSVFADKFLDFKKNKDI